MVKDWEREVPRYHEELNAWLDRVMQETMPRPRRWTTPADVVNALGPIVADMQNQIYALTERIQRLEDGD